MIGKLGALNVGAISSSNANYFYHAMPVWASLVSMVTRRDTVRARGVMLTELSASLVCHCQQGK